MKGWLSPFGILYRSGRAPLVGAIVALMLMASLAWAKGPVVSGPRNVSGAEQPLTWSDYLLLLSSIL